MKTIQLERGKGETIWSYNWGKFLSPLRLPIFPSEWNVIEDRGIYNDKQYLTVEIPDEHFDSITLASKQIDDMFRPKGIA